jgi:hypothetical protein
MSIHDVPRWRWADAFEEFSRGRHGWLASVVIVGPGPVLMSHTGLRPLESVTVAQTGGVRVGFQGGPTVLVEAPGTLRVDRTDDGVERALEIDTADAEFVRVTFRATALPEELDGIAPAELIAPDG